MVVFEARMECEGDGGILKTALFVNFADAYEEVCEYYKRFDFEELKFEFIENVDEAIKKRGYFYRSVWSYTMQKYYTFVICKRNVR